MDRLHTRNAGAHVVRWLHLHRRRWDRLCRAGSGNSFPWSSMSALRDERSGRFRVTPTPSPERARWKAPPTAGRPPVDPQGNPRYHSPQVVLAVWEDGRAIWSPDDLAGGAPYHEGSIRPAQLVATMKELKDTGTYRSLERLESNTVRIPDGSTTVIALAYGELRLWLESSHELFEDDPRLVATEHGTESLDGRDREEVLARQPRRFRQFR